MTQATEGGMADVYVSPLDDAQQEMQRLMRERRAVNKEITDHAKVLLQVWKDHHQLDLGKDVMLKRWTSNYKMPAGPRRARISALNVNDWSGTISMSVVPYTSAGKPGSRSIQVSDEEWEAIGP